MNFAWTILAGIYDSPLNERLMRSATREVVTILFVAMLLSLALVVWAIGSRRRRSRASRKNNHRKATATQPNPETPEAESPRRHRRRHNKYHRRNPTLAETGGLPPRRDSANTPMTGPGFTSGPPPTT